MPPKAHRAGPTGLPRTHSRSSSTGSSKAALNLHLTQKDPAQQKLPEKAKKNGHVHESHTSAYPRVDGVARATSKEQLQALAQRHVPPPNQRQQGGKAKAGFTLPSPTADDDDDWVSSESGAATPNSVGSDSGQSRTPVDKRKVMPATPFAEESIHRPDTPRAQPPSLSRVPTIRPPEFPLKTSAGLAAPAPQFTQTAVEPPIIFSGQAPQPQFLFTESRVAETRSATTSPVHSNHRSSHKRQSLTRPPSTHSTTSRSEAPLRPHPLIRGQSFGQNMPMSPKVVPLAPLTVTSEASPVSSPARDSAEKASTSPSSVRTTYARPPPNRRTSVSSMHSISTLPSQSQVQAHILSKVHARSRTFSSMSSHSSTSVQALSSLAHLPTTRPSTPQHTAHFPPAGCSVNLEAVHPLLPPPYLSAHMSILTHASPLKASYDRVIAAREQKR
ncbi:hypothetical protein PAXRUDRAFT_31042 [Paxillus rubicundulus Ve08.2h10]|uniref:Uncharacterized protein n=1 Tax=Paxillus rubicundulus Ve08.2h10 TaxID=930991 RepID=A0A0D0DJN7_9AGAM|nr:hypothetical protein PAXRUDRAFT_31042 [Paxillus rubicundulus Ve08.2h10]